ncbi:hypothetical protein HY798_03225 [Candidatus Falkowbacteria bacterium]|nr:hypothetical protein [Candidatus Falkowbacteria bacterium]
MVLSSDKGEEEKIMEKDAKIKIGKIILGTLAAAGLLSLAVLAPNAVRAAQMFHSNKKRKYNLDWYVKTAIGRMLKSGLIRFEKKDQGTYVRLTEEGEQKLLRYRLQEIKIDKPKKWDKKWRVIIFDIKEHKKTRRDELRKEFVNFGFLRLQNSVWVYPYECEELIIMLKSYYSFGKDVLYMVVDKIENDKWLKEEFKLI